MQKENDTRWKPGATQKNEALEMITTWANIKTFCYLSCFKR